MQDKLCGWRPEKFGVFSVAVKWEFRELKEVTDKQPDNKLMIRMSEIHQEESKGLH